MRLASRPKVWQHLIADPKALLDRYTAVYTFFILHVKVIESYSNSMEFVACSIEKKCFNIVATGNATELGPKVSL